MPHCIVEYSASIAEQIEVPKLLRKTFEIIRDSGEFEPASIKLRAIAYEDVYSGLSEHSLVHIRLCILSGRSTQQKQALSASLLSQLSASLNMVKSLTVEVVDMDRESYAKRVL
ncbi:MULTISPECIES: 5-carboxymethyl-2-hydroxymuconate Delta-isomerase [unclassified Agarivorans]|uniref:5-carboxymethyl-2-hydroxymuconate Delta-isomerase n=1 Tax=unclassified Agarivorans TaxID=2636026 RepID=UPI003D7CD496